MFVYNLIPENVLQGKILEIGAGSEEWVGENLQQLRSKHRNIFCSNNYLGIDLDPPKNDLLNIIKQDVMTFEPNTKFDTILGVDVIEHIPFEKWEIIFQLMTSWLNPNGYLILSTPYNEPCSIPHYRKHCVFGIKEITFSKILPNAELKIVSHPHVIRTEGENRFWGILRYFKRKLTNHPYLRYKLIIYWKKE